MAVSGETAERPRALLVDDDPSMVTFYQFSLKDESFDVVALSEPRRAIELFEAGERFPVVVADLDMPGIDGLELVRWIKRRSPETVCMILTGNADVDSAISALNEGHLFRFMTKPCTTSALSSNIEAAIEQHWLMTAERDVLERTLGGSVAILSEILALLNPPAFSSATRIKRYVSHIASRLDLSDRWQLEVAALLCRLGCIVVPAHVLDKALAGDPLTASEQELLASHPAVGAELLAKIPRLQNVAAIIEGQNRPVPDPPRQEPRDADPVALGSQVLRAALELDRWILLGYGRSAAIGELRRGGKIWTVVLSALEDVEVDVQPGDRIRKIGVASLRPGMILEEDVRARNGVLLVARGQEVTITVAKRLQGFAQGLGVHEPFSVRLPASPVAADVDGKTVSTEPG
jgi:CheY-like chemotaxis protein